MNSEVILCLMFDACVQKAADKYGPSFEVPSTSMVGGGGGSNDDPSPTLMTTMLFEDEQVTGGGTGSSSPAVEMPPVVPIGDSNNNHNNNQGVRQSVASELRDEKSRRSKTEQSRTYK